LQTAYVNRVATAVPPYDVHDAFRRFAQSLFRHDRRNSLLFERWPLSQGSSTAVFRADLPEGDCLDAEGFYPRGDFPDTAARSGCSNSTRRRWRKLRSIVCISERSATASPIC
jgi:hypothetical protein